MGWLEMDTRRVLLWSAGLALLLVVVAGYLATESIYGSLGYDESHLREHLSSSVYSLARSGGGTIELKGAFVMAGSVIFRRDVVGYSKDVSYDYRFDEFNEGLVLTVLADDFKFECLSALVACNVYGDLVVNYEGLEVSNPDRVDAQVVCIPSGQKMSCVAKILPATSNVFVEPSFAKQGRTALEEDAAELVLFYSGKMADLKRAKTPVIDIFSGKAQSVAVEVIVSVAELGSFLNLAAQSTIDYDAQANEKYGIPFFDGTRSLEEHVNFLKGKVKQPIRVEEPPQRFLLSQNHVFGVSDSALAQSPDSEFLVVVSALSSYPKTKQFIRSSYKLHSLSNNEFSWLGTVYSKRAQGTLYDQASRLELVYLAQKRGFSVGEREQLIANAILWLEAHPDIDKITAFNDEFKKDDVISASSISAKSRGLPVSFGMRRGDAEVFSDMFEVSSSQAKALRNAKAYWIVDKGQWMKYGELKNSYKVILSRQREG